MKTAGNIWESEELVKVLKGGGVAVMPTDTIYGMVGRAQDEAAVNRVYKTRNRSDNKPCIILIGGIEELGKFSLNLSLEQKNALKKYWPRPVSLVLDCPEGKFSYLHRGTKSLAFRLPAQAGLRELLKKTGPLIAPSANTEKFPASESTENARAYFGNAVDLYVDGGLITAKASKVIRLYPDGSVAILRE